MEKANLIAFRVWGKMALFSDPITRVGGEKCTYPVPTYQALNGVLESVYWKPTFYWVIDRVRIMKQIQTQSRGIRPLCYDGGNDLSIYTYLTDVEYQVEAHFEWNENRPDLIQDRNENKHFFIAKRMLERGGRRDVFLGTRECQAYVEPCEFGQGNSYYQNTGMTFGLMLHGLTYPDESGCDQLKVRFWSPVMEPGGVIAFCRPEECTLIRTVKQQRAKQFVPGQNFSFCDGLWEEVKNQ